MKTAKNLLRITVAILFILSGFVKAVDVRGFGFKLEEYFAPDVFAMPFFEKNALAVAAVFILLEFFLGVFLLLKIRVKQVLSAMIALCIFFAFLTFYSAYFHKVTDCGCFGDAIKFTPWQSFAKDLALLLALIILRFWYGKENDSAGKIKISILAISGFIMIFFMVFGFVHEPLIDFRDYKIGTDLITEKEKASKNPAQFLVEFTLKNKKTGGEKKVPQEEYINDKKYWESGSAWEIEQGKEQSTLIKKGYESEVLKFKIDDAAGNDKTAEILHAPKAVLLFCYAPEKADKSLIALAENRIANMPNALVMGISPRPEIFKKIKSGSMDATAIKTIARSNPFILILHSGKITEKYSAKDFLNQ